MDALTDCLNGFSNADDDEVFEQAVVLLLSDMFRLCEALCEACVPILSKRHSMVSRDKLILLVAGFTKMKKSSDMQKALEIYMIMVNQIGMPLNTVSISA